MSLLLSLLDEKSFNFMQSFIFLLLRCCYAVDWVFRQVVRWLLGYSGWLLRCIQLQRGSMLLLLSLLDEKSFNFMHSFIFVVATVLLCSCLDVQTGC